MHQAADGGESGNQDGIVLYCGTRCTCRLYARHSKAFIHFQASHAQVSIETGWKIETYGRTHHESSDHHDSVLLQ